MTDALRRSVSEGKHWPSVVQARSAEIVALAGGSSGLSALVHLPPAVEPAALAAADASTVNEWSRSVLAGLPNLLSAEDIVRHERLLVKLIRLVPLEYSSGVRNGEVLIPIEY